MNAFSIVLAFRDTPRERKFATKSIPSAIRVGPSELILGIDAPADDSFVTFINDLCEKESFQNYKIVCVERSAEWNFQLAHVIWECYKSCMHDKIFAFDIDSILRPTMLNGYDLIGEDGTAIVSFTKKLLIRNLGDLIRYAWYRFRVSRRTNVFSGNYWIYKPYYFANVDLAGFQKIHNGIDTYMVESIIKRRAHSMVTLKDIGVDSMDMQNEDYPWNQFSTGMWLYANRKELSKEQISILRTSGQPLSQSKIHRFISKHPVLFIMLQVVCYQHPWVLRGYMWARKNVRHKAVSLAHNQTLAEWSLTGAQHVKDTYDWKKHGRLGTGYG